MAAENTATFAIDLNAQGAAQGAQQAAGALEALGNKIDDDTEALADMQKALRAMRGEASVNIKALNDMKNAVAAKKATLAQNTAALLAAGGAEATVRSKMKRQQAAALKEAKADEKLRAKDAKRLADEMMREQKTAAKEAAAAQQAAGLKQMAVLGGVAAALAAVGAAALSAAADMVKFAIGSADAYRSERLQLEGLTKVRNWYGLAAGSASDLQAAIDEVSASSALGREQIVGIGKSLYSAGFRGAAWKQALEGVTTATSAAGEAQGELAKQMYLGFGRMGGGVKKVSDEIKARFGGVAAAQMLSLDVQSKKLKESFARLFTGLKLDGFLTGLKSVTDLFSQNTASGRALKAILESVLQPLLDGLADVAPIAKRFFQGMIIAVLQLQIAYYDVRLALKGAFGDVSLFKNIDTLSLALFAGKAAAYTLAAALAIVGVSLALAWAPFVAIGAAAFGVGYALAWAADKVYSAYKALKALDWGSIGKDLVDGFVGGITRGVGKVIKAVTNMAGAAKEALRKALDSHSPSRVGIAIGATLPQGGAIGIRRDTPLVAKAARRMAIVATTEAEPETPRTRLPRSSDDGGDSPTASSARASGGRATAAANVTIHAPITIHGTSEIKAKDIAAEVREVLRTELQTIAATVTGAAA